VNGVAPRLGLESISSSLYPLKKICTSNYTSHAWSSHQQASFTPEALWLPHPYVISNHVLLFLFIFLNQNTKKVNESDCRPGLLITSLSLFNSNLLHQSSEIAIMFALPFHVCWARLISWSSVCMTRQFVFPFLHWGQNLMALYQNPEFWEDWRNLIFCPKTEKNKRG